jgi:transposase
VTKGLAPSEHLVDGGYVTVEGLVRSQATHQITLVGPLSPDHQWQARAEEGYDLSHFQIDWAAQRVTCPQGRVSVQWGHSTQAHGGEGIHVRFRPQECRACAVRAQCTRAKAGPRELTLRPQAQYERLQAARQEQTTADWQKRYNVRAGIEGTLSQGIRAFELRKTRYIGLAKTHLQHLLTAAAINIVRIVNWLNEVPLARTRQSRFAALAPTG